MRLQPILPHIRLHHNRYRQIRNRLPHQLFNDWLNRLDLLPRRVKDQFIVDLQDHDNR
ncbi:hypothetical protein [Lewinella sp. 4G2]|uniref:hypothetical protein n=1 Tax=Lewinella sp. 4G2 TaxID=1803372 RepID=UPI0012FA4279|nr:hypothetical protein [Lewinella sp. 4G2]